MADINYSIFIFFISSGWERIENKIRFLHKWDPHRWYIAAYCSWIQRYQHFLKIACLKRIVKPFLIWYHSQGISLKLPWLRNVISICLAKKYRKEYKQIQGFSRRLFYVCLMKHKGTICCEYKRALKREITTVSGKFFSFWIINMLKCKICVFILQTIS